jgi:hypothetical protein
MWDPTDILKIEDIAHCLSCSVRSIQRLIEAGKIPSFDVSGEPRVLAGALIGWIQAETHVKNLEILKKTLQDKETWAKVLEDNPAVKAQLLLNEYAEGTFGSFLQAAVHENQTCPVHSPTNRTQPRQIVEAFLDVARKECMTPEESGRSGGSQPMRHVFVSYVRENQPLVDRLCAELSSHGINVWRDRDALRPGQRWQWAIREAIREGIYFIACFSNEYSGRSRTYMNEELTVAVEELRTRHVNTDWFIPVRLDECAVPRRSIGAGEDLTDLQWLDLFPDWKTGIIRLVHTINTAR